MTHPMKLWGPECFFSLCYVLRFGWKGHFRQNLCVWLVWFCRNPAWGSSQINWTKMKSGQSLVRAELIPYRSFTLLVVTLATMNLVIIEFGLGITLSHFCTTQLGNATNGKPCKMSDCLATQRLAASTLGLRYTWIRSQILKRWLFNFIQSKLKLLKLNGDKQMICKTGGFGFKFKLAAFQSHVHLFVIYAAPSPLHSRCCTPCQTGVVIWKMQTLDHRNPYPFWRRHHL